LKSSPLYRVHVSGRRSVPRGLVCRRVRRGYYRFSAPPLPGPRALRVLALFVVSPPDWNRVQKLCQTPAQVVCRSHKRSSTRTSGRTPAQNAGTLAQAVGRAHRSSGHAHRLSGLSHSLRDERTSGRTRAQPARTECFSRLPRAQVRGHAHKSSDHAHSLPDTRTGRRIKPGRNLTATSRNLTSCLRNLTACVRSLLTRTRSRRGAQSSGRPHSGGTRGQIGWPGAPPGPRFCLELRRKPAEHLANVRAMNLRRRGSVPVTKLPPSKRLP
jgi:hypothetical protein